MPIWIEKEDVFGMKRSAAESEKLIVALDVATIERAQALVNRLSRTVKTFKIGSQLYCAAGPKAIRIVRKQHCEVFLDLKFYDIPSVVSKAAEALVAQRVSMFTVHISGGMNMMTELVKTVDRAAKKFAVRRPKILGVTVLTSINDDDLKEFGIKRFLKDQVIYLAQVAKNAGLDGVIASAEEAHRIKQVCAKDFLVVTPGVRPRGSKAGDQKRIMTPRQAISEGADYIVVGRPVVESPDPLKVARAILKEITPRKK
ncbi:MAG: orotidine-5'-phosphate decarboxylase [Candidatus Omnitrophota bacterium]